MPSRTVLRPLTGVQLLALRVISRLENIGAIPAADIEALSAHGYIEKGSSGFVLTDQGIIRLAREQASSRSEE
jgi:hypothetical protein